jgi:hypothetical protein
MGVRLVHDHVEEEGGGWPRCVLELGAPDTSGVRSGGGSPRTAALGHTRGRQGKREKEEKAGAPMSGSARRVGPSCREREKMGGGKRGRRVGPTQGGTRWQGEDADPWAPWV